MLSEHEAYDRLCAYTLNRGDAAFIHQHVVDAFAAQHAGGHTKAITITFALVGLYLHVEKAFSGRDVQRLHMRLARHKRSWPVFVLPPERGSVTATSVLVAPEGPERERAIDAWCVSVWEAFGENRPTVIALLQEYGYFDEQV